MIVVPDTGRKDEAGGRPGTGGWTCTTRGVQETREQAMGINWVGHGSVLTGAVRAIRKALTGATRLGDVKVKGSHGILRPSGERKARQAARRVRMATRSKDVAA